MKLEEYIAAAGEMMPTAEPTTIHPGSMDSSREIMIICHNLRVINALRKRLATARAKLKNALDLAYLDHAHELTKEKLLEKNVSKAGKNIYIERLLAKNTKSLEKEETDVTLRYLEDTKDTLTETLNAYKKLWEIK